MEEPRGTALSQICPGKLHGNGHCILEDIGGQLLWSRLGGWSSAERGCGGIAGLRACPIARCNNAHQDTALPVAAVQLWLAGGAIFNQATPFMMLAMLRIIKRWKGNKLTRHSPRYSHFRRMPSPYNRCHRASEWAQKPTRT